MKKPADPRELAEAILHRSSCNVQVGAVLADGHGIFAWGWNSSGPDGMGQHAEAHCLSRANRERVANGSVLYVAAIRQRTGRPVIARPCQDCMPKLRSVSKIFWRDSDGTWKQC